MIFNDSLIYKYNNIINKRSEVNDYIFYLYFRSYEYMFLDNFVKEVCNLLSINKISFKGAVPLKTQREFITLFKPRFIHKKKSKEHFALETHIRLLVISDFFKFNILKKLNKPFQVEVELVVKKL